MTKKKSNQSPNFDFIESSTQDGKQQVSISTTPSTEIRFEKFEAALNNANTTSEPQGDDEASDDDSEETESGN